VEISGVGALPPSSPSFPVQQNPSPSFAVQQNPTPSFAAPKATDTQTPPAQQAAKNPQPKETQHNAAKRPHDPQPPNAPGPPQGLQPSSGALSFAPGQVVDFHA